MFRLMTNSSACFTMGSACRWRTFTKCGAGLAQLVHAKVPYSEDAPIAGLYPTTCKSLDNITKRSSISTKNTHLFSTKF
jgi:hypothetical protein